MELSIYTVDNVVLEGLNLDARKMVMDEKKKIKSDVKAIKALIKSQDYQEAYTKCDELIAELKEVDESLTKMAKENMNATSTFLGYFAAFIKDFALTLVSLFGFDIVRGLTIGGAAGAIVAKTYNDAAVNPKVIKIDEKDKVKTPKDIKRDNMIYGVSKGSTEIAKKTVKNNTKINAQLSLAVASIKSAIRTIEAKESKENNNYIVTLHHVIATLVKSVNVLKQNIKTKMNME